MPRLSLPRVLVIACLLSAACASIASAAASARASSTRPGAVVRAARAASPLATAATSSQPLSPQQVRSFYALPSTGARDQTIAVISAYNDPTIAHDLAEYSSYFNLPACTSRNGCLTVRNEEGKASPLPETDPTGGTWRTEASLGTETVHGVCESCKIVLYESNSLTPDDLSATVNAAAEHGATVVVTTFEPEDSAYNTQFALDYSHAKTAIVSATGEAINQTYGYSGTLNFPASLPSVLAVGGTDVTLGRNSTYGSEQAWSDTVSGCSLFALAGEWQAADAASVGCGQMRVDADLAAISNPGVYFYASDLTADPGGPLYVAEGTSVAAPVIAAEIGLAGSLGANESQQVYAHAKSDPAAFHHINSGETSPGCTTKLCKAGPGFNGPTGLGSPYGLAAFLQNGGALPNGTPDLHVITSRINVSHWTAPVRVTNNIGIALTGTVSVSARIGGRTVTLASQRLKFGPVQSLVARPSISSRYRSAIAGARSIPAVVSVKIHGVGGRTATVRRTVVLAL